MFTEDSTYVISLHHEKRGTCFEVLALGHFSFGAGFDPRRHDRGSGHQAGTVGLFKSGFFDVVERDKLKNIMEEHSLNVSGLVDSTQSMLTLGKLLNADIIITGAVVNFGKQEQVTTAFGVTTKKTAYHLEVSVKELDVNTAKIVFADFFTADYDVLVSNGSVTADNIHRQLLKQALEKAIKAVADLEQKSQPPAAEATIMVAFTSEPTGADVVVDGVYMGATPVDLPLKEGIHVVKISKGGYQPWENKVNIYQGMKPISVTLAAVPQS